MDLPGDIATWVDAATACTLLCARCGRSCRHVSISATLDHCTWHRACDRMATHDTVEILPRRPSMYRSGEMSDEMKRFVLASNAHPRELARVDRASWFLTSSGVGTCGRAAWSRRNDCQIDMMGSFRVHAADKQSWNALAASCTAQCDRCSRCVHLSVSLTYGACSWYVSPLCIATVAHHVASVARTSATA